MARLAELTGLFEGVRARAAEAKVEASESEEEIITGPKRHVDTRVAPWMYGDA